MRKTAAIIMILTIGSKFFGFFRDITLSYFYGASNISDAYLVSQQVPMSILEFIGLGLLTGYIPIYSKIQTEDGELKSNDFNNNVINIVIVISSILVFFGVFFTEEIVKMFAMGFEGETLDLAVKFTKISVLGIYSISLGYIFKGYLQIKENYIVPAVTGFPLNIVIISSIFISTYSSTLILTVGSLLAVSSQLFILVPYAHKKGFRYKFYLDIRDKHIRSLWHLAIPMMIGVSVNQVNVLVDRTLASQIVEGGISALNYAYRLNFFVQGIFVLSISTVLYPIISKMAAEDSMYGLKKSISEAINSIEIMVIPATVGAMIFAEPIVGLLFGRGAFDKQAVLLTSNALFFYSIGMVAYGLREVLSKVFYSLQDTRTPMFNAALAMVMNIILNLILSRFMGIGGLALATSISAIVCTVLLFISLRKKIGPFGMKNISISFIKILCASVIMGVIAKLSFNYLVLVISLNLSLVFAIGIGAITYFIIIYFMKIEDVDAMVNLIKRKVKTRTS